MFDTIEFISNGQMRFIRRCPITRREYCVEAGRHHINDWREGMKISEAIPYLTDKELEFLSTGRTPAEQENPHAAESLPDASDGEYLENPEDYENLDNGDFWSYP